LQRRNWIAAAAALVAISPFLASTASAQAWPTRPIKLVVPFTPGGLTDNLVRLVAPKLALELGQPIVIDKKLPYKPEQIAPVALLGRVPNVLEVNPAAGINTLAELTARARSKPGQLNYASNGQGTSLKLD